MPSTPLESTNNVQQDRHYQYLVCVPRLVVAVAMHGCSYGVTYSSAHPFSIEAMCIKMASNEGGLSHYIFAKTLVPAHKPTNVPNALPKTPTRNPGTTRCFQPFPTASAAAVGGAPMHALEATSTSERSSLNTRRAASSSPRCTA
mmetsp:Transcript_11214/g.23393  ORF Transcript_11214/g.23393 Transcript_11214/m.23393 type:complete len:145 (-) Transcript_11214:1435-1869(-)